MKKLIFYVVLSTVMSFMILGNSVLIKNVVYTKSVKGEWSKKTFENNGFTLPYQIYTPKDTKNKKLPLVIYLHGTGEAGTDNEAQMYKGKNIGPDYFSSPEIQGIQAAYVLAPQTPKDMRWASTTLDEYDLSTTPVTPSMEALLKLIDEVSKKYPIDTDRIYIAGLSRGGQGTWNAALLKPEKFAAVVPIAGSGGVKDAGKLSKTAIWVFHGDEDEVTKVNYSRNMVFAIIKAGSTPDLLRYTEIRGGNHEASWLTAHKNSDLYSWMIQWELGK